MLFSIVIPTCHRNSLLIKCLDTLYPLVSSDSSNFEVIVTDDSVNNNAKKIMEQEYTWVKWTEGPKKGPAANRNNGAKFSTGSWLIFIDDDCIPQKDWLSSYVDALQTDPHFKVFEGCTIADRKKRRFDEEAPLNVEGNKLWSCNFAINRDFFLDLKGFDETFPYAAMEDVDLYLRVLKVENIKFVPEALVVHPWRRIKLFKTFKKHLKSHIHLSSKYGVRGSAKFRWSRFKIFIGAIVFEFNELRKFSMRGWPIYLEKMLFKFLFDIHLIEEPLDR